jgi:Tol biopolymer transport system component
MPFVFSAPSWAADGSRVAFTGLAHRRNGVAVDVYLASPDGAGIAKVPGSRMGLDPVLSPDGRTLAFARIKRWVRDRHGKHPRIFRSVSIWLTGIDGRGTRQLTPWRSDLFQYPASFSPDGSALAITRNFKETEHLALVMPLNGAPSTVLAHNAGEPVYSPDGTHLALITVGKSRTIGGPHGTTTYAPTELAVANADGSDLHRLTNTPRRLELQPSWDPSGQRLVYTEMKAGGNEADFFGIGDSLMEVNADGSCSTRVLSEPRATLFGATWQPGPGREAGPISC